MQRRHPLMDMFFVSIAEALCPASHEVVGGSEVEATGIVGEEGAAAASADGNETENRDRIGNGD